MWRIYKEGQGKWGRGLLAFVVAIGAMYAVVSLHEALPEKDKWIIPVLSWSFDYRFLVDGPVLIAALALGVWLFNRPQTADFLIDSENELKTKVTWPSKKEEINASMVVVVTVLIIGAFIFVVDNAFILLQNLVFRGPKGNP